MPTIPRESSTSSAIVRVDWGNLFFSFMFQNKAFQQDMLGWFRNKVTTVIQLTKLQLQLL
jgi:hypothetical protein